MTSACLDQATIARPVTIPHPHRKDASHSLRAGAPVLVLGHDAHGRARAVLAADAGAITAEAVNVMARFGGVVSCAVDAMLADRLGLSRVPATRRDDAPMYLRSVEAVRGVSTGISAADRAATLRAIAADDACAGDLVTPGHIMPNLVQPGGRTLPDAVLALLRAACQARAAAWCDMLDDDGEPADHRAATAIAAQAGIAVIATPALPVGR